MRHRRPRHLLVAALALAASGVAVPAAAEEPTYLEDAVFDPVDALTDAEEQSAAEQIETLREETGLQLFVAYVDTFTDTSGSTIDGREWAELTSQESGMGAGDLVLAVAVDERAYGLGDIGETLSDAQLQTIRLEDVEPRLAQDDWAGAIEGAVDGFAREYEQGPSSGGVSVPDGEDVYPQSSGSGLGGAFPLLFFAPLAIGGVAMVVQRVRRRPDPGAKAPDRAQGPSLPELHRQASEALVGMDDAVRSAGEELDFARAQFGEQQTQAFSAALERARAAAREAFALRQQLDDDSEEAESVQRGMLGRILQLTGQSRQELDAQTEEFARLRSLQDRAPQFLAELETRARETRDRLPVAEQELSGLRARHPEQALATVRANLERSTNLLDSADGFVTAGRQSLERDDRASAVAAARAAEESIGQAAALLDQVAEADAQLRGADEAIAEGIASLSADLQDARPHGGEPTIAQAVQRARAAIEQAQGSGRGGDPLRALAELDAAEHALDALLEPLREADRHQAKLRGDFEARVSRVGARLRSIDQTVSTARGAVNSSARTRISEALRLYDDAVTRASESPTAAMDLLTRAEQLGERALTEAQRDTDHWGSGSGGFGSPYSRGRSRGIDPWSVILGGILSGAGSSHRHRGGWGGGGFSGGGFGGGRGIRWRRLRRWWFRWRRRGELLWRPLLSSPGAAQPEVAPARHTLDIRPAGPATSRAEKG